MCCNQQNCGCGCLSPCSYYYLVGPRGPQGPRGAQGPQGEAGTVTPAAAVSDVVVTDATATINAEKINEILAALRTAGLMET